MKEVFVLIFAAALVLAGCKKSEDNSDGFSLSVEPAGISASVDGGACTFTVGSNTKWSVTVTAGATWCVALPTAGTGNGTVTVNIMENAATVTRAATVTVTADVLNKMVNVTQDASSLYQYEATNAPPHAATNTAWVFGSQTWSDAIRMPGCSNSSLTTSDTEPHCRSYTHEDNTYYYYNWPYVVARAGELCPSPWRVPTRADLVKLENMTYLNAVHLEHLWGLGGFVVDTRTVYTAADAFYWSSTALTSDEAFALHYPYPPIGVIPPSYSHLKFLGYQVRCVK
jgi:hypothetical protein